MSKYYLIQDSPKCIGCHACEVQCKSTKNLPPGPHPCRIIEIFHENEGKPAKGNLLKSSHVFMPCFHCETPWCVAACTTGAMQKREKDGIVFVDQSLCVGCKTCISACPWGAPQWDPVSGKTIKCDYCKDRLDKGLLPACVTICITGCLQFGKAEEMPGTKRMRFAGKIAGQVSSQGYSAGE